jgi:hypothetical protein
MSPLAVLMTASTFAPSWSLGKSASVLSGFPSGPSFAPGVLLGVLIGVLSFGFVAWLVLDVLELLHPGSTTHSITAVKTASATTGLR